MDLKNKRIYKRIRKIVKKTYDIKNRIKERTFISSDGVKLKHLLFRTNKSDCLLVGFSGCFEGGAIYNYVGACAKYKINKLFIKDDFASNHRGCYYIGSNCKFDVEKAVYELIDMVISKRHIKKIIFIGTSKGGYAALNFALQYPDSVVVCGAPQYYVADYLRSHNFEVNLKEILGDDGISSENISMLNKRLQGKITSNINPGQYINILYSDVEHTYQEHIKDMLDDLHRKKYKMYEQVEKFPEHGDVGKHFPQFLQSRLKEILYQ